MQHTNNKTTSSRGKIITNQLIRMSSMPKIMSSVITSQLHAIFQDVRIFLSL